MVSETKDRLAAIAGRSVCIRAATDVPYYRRSATSMMGKVLRDLGLEVPDSEDYAEVSKERLGDLMGTDLSW